MEQHAGEVDLLLTDVVMPDMNGPEMTRKMRCRSPDLRCLFMSGHDSNLLDERPPGLSSSGWLLKPFSRQILAQHVSLALTKG